MADTKYTYSVYDDFPNHVVANGILYQEIIDSSITSATVLYIDVNGDDCDIWFDGPLTTGDEAVLDTIVSNHQGKQPPASTMMTFRGDGYYRNSSGIDIVEIVEEFVIDNIVMRRAIAGTGGQTTVDILKNGTTIFTTQSNRPKILASSGDDARVVATPDVTSVVSGDKIEMNIVETEDGDPQDVVVFVNRV